ncbi:MAG TPA: GNAT family N-acetyltransferase, partial [Actinomycetota bacterium]|nr:GNAT family N-acetyltransferase [Actinomycetota bacterium]
MPPAPPVQVERWTNGAAWDQFVAGARDGNVGHRWAWMGIVSGVYRHRTFPLAAIRDGVVVGVLPLVLVRSRLFGRHLVSMPFLDSGGLCTDGDVASERALVATAVELADSHGAKLELRHLSDRQIGLPASLEKVTMTLDLRGGEDAVWRRMRSTRRGQVRKARRNGLEASWHGEEAVGQFYRVWAVNMRDLGSPAHRRAYFRRIAASFPDDARIVLVRDGSETIGAAMALVHGDRIVLPWVSSLRSSFARGPNQLLYWEAFRYGVERGCTVFDFGRSSRNSGTF